MKSILISFLVFLAILFVPSLAYAQQESPSPTPTPTSSYELFYPIVAGKVQGDALFSLKLFKEKVVGFLIFNPIKKADYHLVLSKKRLVETEKLLFVNNDFKNAEKSIDRFVSEYENATNLAKKAENKGESTTDLFNALSEEGMKELNFLKSMVEKLDENQKAPFEDAASSFEELVGSVKISS